MIFIFEAQQSATFTEKPETILTAKTNCSYNTKKKIRIYFLSYPIHFPKFSPIYTGGPTTLQMNSQIYLTSVLKKNSMAESQEM